MTRTDLEPQLRSTTVEQEIATGLNKIGLGNRAAANEAATVSPTSADTISPNVNVSVEALSQLTVRRVIGATLVVMGVSMGFWLLYRF